MPKVKKMLWACYDLGNSPYKAPRKAKYVWVYHTWIEARKRWQEHANNPSTHAILTSPRNITKRVLARDFEPLEDCVNPAYWKRKGT